MSMKIKHAIKCDFQRPGVRPTVHVKENDMATRFVVCEFFDDGEPYVVSPTATCVVKYAKSDGTSGVYDTIDTDTARERSACVFSENYHKATIELAPNILIGFGLVRIDLSFVGTDEILSTFTFNVQVERSVTDGSRADDYFSYRALDELYAAIDKATEDAAAALAATEIDISTEYAEAKVSDPALTPERFMLSRPDGRYKIVIGMDDDRVLIGRRLTVSGYFCLSVDDFYGGQEHSHSLYLDEYRVYTITASIQDDPVSINPKTLVGDLATAKSDIAALQAENVVLRNRVDKQGYELENLIVAGDGKIYTKSVDSSEAYTKNVPANALPNAVLDSIGGKSVVLNQIVADVASGGTAYGITRQRTAVGTIHVYGTSERSTSFVLVNNVGVYTSGRVYFVSLGVSQLPAGARINTSQTDGATASIVIGDGSDIRYGAFVNEGTTIDAEVKPYCIDLTKMFGAGNEPQTVDQAYAMGVPRTSIPPNDGEIVSADVQSINASGKAPKPIPQAVRNLPGYGWSAGNVYNEVDYAHKQYVQKVDRGDMGSMGWNRAGADQSLGLYAYAIPGKAFGIGNIITSAYQNTTITSWDANKPDMSICGSASSRTIVIRDTSVANAAELKAKLSGVYLYFEVEEPITTDISNLLPANFEVLPVEDSGTVTFQQANGTTLPVPATITFPVKIGGDA